MTYEITRDGVTTPLVYGPFTDANGVGHPYNVLDLWTDEALAEIGVVRVAPTPEEVKAALGAYAMTARWLAEQGGIQFDGHVLPTNDKGQSYIAGAHQAAMADAGLTKRWQVGNDPIAFVTFSNDQLRALGLALNSLVQATFDTLDEVAPQIEDDTITTEAEVDAAFAAINRAFTS